MKKVIKKAKAMGARQERRKSVASAVADSDDKEEVDALEKEISELEAKKAAALESEDYDEAKNIKDKIDTLAEKMDNE
jgi:protein-arginine kinase activator protein McsA